MTAQAWAPPADEQLTWFLPGPALPELPQPLEYTGEVNAFVFGLTRALESLDFPLYEVRSRLVDRRLYLASVPSARAEADLPRKLQRAHDAGLRYTQDIRRGWERGPRQEAEAYNQEIKGFGTGPESPAELADGMRPLLRTHSNAWFVAFRSALAPAAMLQADAQATLPEAASGVVHDALVVVRERGADAFRGALQRVGERLAQAGVLDRPEDVMGLEWEEARRALRDGTSRQALVELRQTQAASARRTEAASTLGPHLAADAPRMYLVREILALLATPRARSFAQNGRFV